MSRARDRVGEDGSKLSARSGLPAYSGGDESSSCSRAASGRVCRRIAKLSLCPRCRWFVIPSEVDETERDEQCPVDRRQPSTGEVCRVAGRGALGRRSESDGRARSSRAGSYIPIDRHGANLFFQLVSRRYERGAIILTSNQSLGAWGDVFGDPAVGTAVSGALRRVRSFAVQRSVCRPSSYHGRGHVLIGQAGLRPRTSPASLLARRTPLQRGTPLLFRSIG